MYEPSPGEAATQALMAIGPAAWETLKAVLLSGAEWRSSKNAAWALAHRASAVEQLIAASQDPAWQVRAQTCYALFQRGGASPAVIQSLVGCLEDEAWQVREQAAMALAQKGSSSESFFAPLVATLKDDNPKVREAAAFALGFSADDPEVDRLIAAKNDSDPRVRAGIKRALAVIKQRMNGTTTNLRKRKI